jgi:hypothetical protein
MADAPIIHIEKASIAGTRLAFAFCGETGTGKTKTALLFGYGLANKDSKKLGFLCTENRRGRLYSKALPNEEEFWIADLAPPFSPQRHIDAIKEFEKAGIEVLIIDTASHEWEGVGGILEIARLAGGNDRWAKAKPLHVAFVNYMLQSPVHIIVCLRARNKSKPVGTGKFKDGKEIMQWVAMGVQPIQEKGFMFDMSASLLMHDEGKRQTVIKCPEELRPYLGRAKGYITVEDGVAVRKWVDGGGVIDPEINRWRDIVMNTASQGTEALQKVWENDVPAQYKKILGKPFINMAKASAEEFARQKQGLTGNSTIDNLNASLVTAKPGDFEVEPDENEDEQIC